MHRTSEGKEFSIRRSKADDVRTILKFIGSIAGDLVVVLNGGSPEDVRAGKEFLSKFDGRSAVFFVAESEGRVVAISEVRRGRTAKTKHTAWLSMAVRPGMRRQGVGSQMLKESIAWARKSGAKKLHTEALATSEGVKSFFKKFGFHIEGQRRGQYRIGRRLVDEIQFAKFL